MPTRTHTRSIPRPRAGIEVRLPWWGIALPVIAFAVLLTLLIHPVDAQAASADPSVSQLVEHVQTALSPAP
ncbi:hypothetical protein [Streptomyces apocyni]|uniref:hypothetical protein n=1 Tax=Streptomyces apocyni TaxID=2654677 RepID=UPI0012EA011F|nr:hypothetical protein [Streptomyces apocyni]